MRTVLPRLWILSTIRVYRRPSRPDRARNDSDPGRPPGSARRERGVRRTDPGGDSGPSGLGWSRGGAAPGVTGRLGADGPVALGGPPGDHDRGSGWGLGVEVRPARDLGLERAALAGMLDRHERRQPIAIEVERRALGTQGRGQERLHGTSLG